MLFIYFLDGILLFITVEICLFKFQASDYLILTARGIISSIFVGSAFVQSVSTKSHRLFRWKSMLLTQYRKPKVYAKTSVLWQLCVCSHWLCIVGVRVIQIHRLSART